MLLIPTAPACPWMTMMVLGEGSLAWIQFAWTVCVQYYRFLVVCFKGGGSVEPGGGGGGGCGVVQQNRQQQPQLLQKLTSS